MNKIIRLIKRHSNIFLAIGSPIIFFTIVEILFHFVPNQTVVDGPLRFLNPFWDGHHFFKSDKDLFWIFKPNIEIGGSTPQGETYQIPINSLGFKGPEYDPVKYANYSRILCLGDSVTFCWEVPLREGYPEQLESFLKKVFPTKLIKVINAGIPAYSSFQVVRVYKKYVDYFKPSIVVVWVASNDASDAYLYPDKENAIYQRRYYFLRELLLKSRFCSFLTDMYQRIRAKHLSPQIMAKEARDGHILRVSLPDFKANLNELVRMTREKNQHLILMTRHTYQKTNPLLDDYNTVIKQVAHKNHVALVDIASMISGHKYRYLYNRASEDVVHLNSIGNDTVAREVANTIIKNKYL